MYAQNIWTPKFGPHCTDEGCSFRLLARPDARVELILEGSADSDLHRSEERFSLQKQPNGIYEVMVPQVGAGTLYRFLIDGQGPFPDPASYYQPHGVHGPSQVVDARSSNLKKSEWKIPAWRECVLYELHVGAFTPEGTFLAAIKKLDILRELGVNAIELMPIADFSGDRNWGYDGVALYAPAHAYGSPEDLRSLIDAAHQRGFAVFLDVVYNHLGPDGAYHSAFFSNFYSNKHTTPWGDGLNFDDQDCELVREFFLDNALYWIHTFQFDGLRLDATHAIQDTSSQHFLTELTQRVHQSAVNMQRSIYVIAEDDRNERALLIPVENGGMGFDAVWSDDFHHHMRRRLAGDRDGYFADFDGTTEHIAATIRDGWFYQGKYSTHAGHARGTAAEGLSPESRIFCLQNHDQVGNRAFGERLSTQIGLPKYRAALALLLLAPEIPLLFMGQEWAASEPFLYFTNHVEPLGQQVTAGRRREFSRFAAFVNLQEAQKIPDPQAEETFLRSKLNWEQRLLPDFAACWRWYQALLRLRQRLMQEPSMCVVRAVGEFCIELIWKVLDGTLCAIICFDEKTKIQQECWRDLHQWMTSEDSSYCCDSQPVHWERSAGSLAWKRPGAVILLDSKLKNHWEADQ